MGRLALAGKVNILLSEFVSAVSGVPQLAQADLMMMREMSSALAGSMKSVSGSCVLPSSTVRRTRRRSLGLVGRRLLRRYVQRFPLINLGKPLRLHHRWSSSRAYSRQLGLCALITSHYYLGMRLRNLTCSKEPP